MTTFALLLLSAAAIQAQEPTAPVDPAPAQAEVRPTDDRTPPAPVVDLDPRNTTAGAIEAATLRLPADAETPAQGIDTPRNFWWLVGAIVLAGIILAVVL